MNGHLLDTNIVSTLAPSKRETSAGLLNWLERIDGEGRAFLSVVTVLEIEKGVSLLEHKGAAAKASELRRWLAGLVAGFDDKILPLDPDSAALAGQLEAKAIHAGHNPGMADAAIAGIAKARGLIVVTRNARHFLPFEIAVLTPDDIVDGRT
ncbi:MAG: type II toxin-antitoxin system VapC family toxin [Elsteraceae bacterium]